MLEVVEWNKRWTRPFPYCPVNRQCPWKETLIEKKNDFTDMGQKMKENELKLTFLYWSAFTASML